MRVRVSDWIANYLKSIGVRRVHGIMGGGAAGLNDGFIKQNMEYVCYHHEQGAGHAATAEAKLTGKLSVVNPTTGCGGTNCATSVLVAWQDSVPVLFLSGNVKAETCSSIINAKRNINLRKYGTQEHNVVDTYKLMTKFSFFVTDAKDIPYTLQFAIHRATSGRPGPVWIDIPGNVQTAEMPETYQEYKHVEENIKFDFETIKAKFEQVERPLVLIGNGIRQSKTTNAFKNFIEKYQIPYVRTYGASDVLPETHYLNIGSVGIKASRAGNFAMQNCDLLLILGTSLGSSIIGYDPLQFSPNSHKILVDIDRSEIDKDIIKIDQKFLIPLDIFFRGML